MEIIMKTFQGDFPGPLSGRMIGEGFPSLLRIRKIQNEHLHELSLLFNHLSSQFVVQDDIIVSRGLSPTGRTDCRLSKSIWLRGVRGILVRRSINSYLTIPRNFFHLIWALSLNLLSSGIWYRYSGLSIGCGSSGSRGVRTKTS